MYRKYRQSVHEYFNNEIDNIKDGESKTDDVDKSQGSDGAVKQNTEEPASVISPEEALSKLREQIQTHGMG